MALFGPQQFDPSYYQGGGLLGNLTQADLLRSLGIGQPETPLQPQVGPTFANGNSGMMGGVPFPIAPAQDATTELSAQSQQPQAAPPAPSPAMGGGGTGLGDNLNAGLQGFTNAKNPMQALGNLIGGFATGQRTDPMGMMLHQEVATREALRRSNVPSAVADAAALNPEILKTIAPTYFDTAPKLEKLTDMMGNQVPYWSKTGAGTPSLTPALGGAAGGTGLSGSAQTFDAIAKARDAGASQDQLIGMVPPELKSYVKALINGDAVPTNLPMRGNARTNALTLAHAIDPTFDEQLIPMRKTFATSMGSQQLNSFGGQVRSSGTIVKHIGRAADALDTIAGSGAVNETLPIMNRAQLYLKGQSGDQKFNDAMGRWDTATEGLAGELTQLLTGGVGAESAKQEWRDKLDLRTQPLSKVKAALDEAAHLMMGRLSNVAQARERAFGKPTDPISLLGPEEQAIAKKVAAGTYQGQAATAPQQQITATGPNGQKLMLQGNQWVPVK